MTVNTNSPVSGPYLTDGVNKNWQFVFRITDVTQMTLVTRLLDDSDEQVITTGFTIDPSYLNKDTGGTVVYPAVGAALATGRKVFAVRQVPYAQPQRIGNQGAFFPQIHEDTFDLLEMQVQQLKEKSDRTLVALVGQDPSAVVQQLTDAVVDAQGFATASAASAAASAASAVASASSASDSAGSADLANKFANNAEDVPVLPGLFSAKHFMLKCQAILATITNTMAGWIHAATAKTVMADADEFGFWNAAGGDLNKITSANFWAQARWRSRGVGELYTVNTAIAGVDIPPSSTTDTVWIELTSGLTGVGAFNNSKVSGESVSGAAPLVLASAVISFAGSPINGQTVQLINTEGRMQRPSTSPGTLQNDALQGHLHPAGMSALVGAIYNVSGGRQEGQNGNNTGNPVTDGVNGTPRTANETRVKNIGVKTYMRIK